MAHATRTRIAALVTLLSLGGLSAIGLGLRSQGEAQTTGELATKAKPRVIHKRKYVDVPGSAPASATPAASYVPAVSTPAVVQAPTKVATQVSPTGGGGYGDDDDGNEVENENEVHGEIED